MTVERIFYHQSHNYVANVRNSSLVQVSIGNVFCIVISNTFPHPTLQEKLLQRSIGFLSSICLAIAPWYMHTWVNRNNPFCFSWRYLSKVSSSQLAFWPELCWLQKAWIPGTFGSQGIWISEGRLGASTNQNGCQLVFFFTTGGPFQHCFGAAINLCTCPSADVHRENGARCICRYHM